MAEVEEEGVGKFFTKDSSKLKIILIPGEVLTSKDP